MKVRNLLGALEDSQQEHAVPEFCLPRCRVGLEYEWEKTKKFPAPPENFGNNEEVAPQLCGVPYIDEVLKYFKVHIDGSLRNDGKEFSFRGGFSGSKILLATAAMEECSRILEFGGSYRTSLHVHIDMQDVEFPQGVELFGAVYSVVESFLYQFVGSNRQVCNYCIPWYKHPQQFESFLKIIRCPLDGSSKLSNSPHIVSSLRGGKGNKYAGLNCFSLGDFGTVEFRQAPVTLQRAKIIAWINVLMRIKEWVVANPMSLTKFVDFCNSNRADWVLHDIFKTHYPEVVRLSRNLEADYWNGMETLYQYVSI